MPGTPAVLRMHPLVRDASRTPGTVAVAIGIVTAAVLTDDFEDGMDSEVTAAWRSLAPHILDAFEQADLAGLDEPSFLELMTAVNVAGRQLLTDGLHARARAVLEAVRAAESEHLPPTHPHTFVTRHNLALVLRDQGEAAQARAELEAVLAVETERLGPDHRTVQITRRSLDGVLRMLEGR